MGTPAAESGTVHCHTLYLRYVRFFLYTSEKAAGLFLLHTAVISGIARIGYARTALHTGRAVKLRHRGL